MGVKYYALQQGFLTDDNGQLANDPALQQETPIVEKKRLEVATKVAQADSLREKGEIKAAYDLLVVALKTSPNDPDLLMSLSPNTLNWPAEVFNVLSLFCH